MWYVGVVLNMPAVEINRRKLLELAAVSGTAGALGGGAYYLRRKFPDWVMDPRVCAEAIPVMDPVTAEPIPEAVFNQMSDLDRAVFLRRGGYASEWWDGSDVRNFVSQVQTAAFDSIVPEISRIRNRNENWEREHFKITNGFEEFLSTYLKLHKNSSVTDDALRSHGTDLWNKAWAFQFTDSDGIVWEIGDFSKIYSEATQKNNFTDAAGQIIPSLVCMHISVAIAHELDHTSGFGKYTEDEKKRMSQLFDQKVTTTFYDDWIGRPSLSFIGGDGMTLKFFDAKTNKTYVLFDDFEEAIRAYDQYLIEKQWGLTAVNTETMGYYNGARLIQDLNQRVGLTDQEFQLYLEFFRQTNRTNETDIDSLGQTRINFLTWIDLYRLAAIRQGYKTITEDDIVDMFTAIDNGMKKFNSTIKSFSTYSDASCSVAWDYDVIDSQMQKIFQDTQSQIRGRLFANSPTVGFLSRLLFSHGLPKDFTESLRIAVSATSV